MTRWRMVLMVASVLVVAGAVSWLFVAYPRRSERPMAGNAAPASVAAGSALQGRKIKAQLFYVSEDGTRLIGVEHDVPFAEPQYETLAKLTRDLFERYGRLDVAGHSDIAPQRKTDPGPWFDWERFRASIA